MSDKALVYRVTITNLIPIENKDRIVLAEMQETAFKCIVQKDEFKIGDQGIYFEVGSILPIEPEFQFLEKRCYSPKYNGFKIKTMKMGDSYSEGLLLPYFSLEHKLPRNKAFDPNDLTEIFGVRRVEDEVPCENITIKKSWFERKIDFLLYKLFKYRKQKMGFTTCDFPDYCIKTDETQAQSIPNLFENMKGIPVYITLKMDGQSCTMAIKDGIFTISTRNRTIYKDKIKRAIKVLNEKTVNKVKNISAHAYVAAKYNIPKGLSELRGNIAIQGEVCGPGIQKNKIGLKDFEFYIFNFYVIDQKQYFGWDVIKNLKRFGWKTVPFCAIMTFNFENIKQLENFVSPFTYENGTPAEGIVFRGYNYGNDFIDRPLTKMHAMLSFKMINPKFKMKYQNDE